MESDGNVRTPGSAAYFLVGSSRVPCGPAVSGQLTIPVGRPMSNQDVSGPSLIVQMTPSRSQTQDHHARATVVRTTNQPVTMHRFPLQLNHASANHILSPNQHFKQIPVYQVTKLFISFTQFYYFSLFIYLLLTEKCQFHSNGIGSKKCFCFNSSCLTPTTLQPSRLNTSYVNDIYATA